MKRFLKIGLIFTLLFTFHVNNIYTEEVEGTPDPTQENSLVEEVKRYVEKNTKEKYNK